MTNLGWDLPAAKTGASAFEYDPYAPAPAPAAVPNTYAAPAPAPAAPIEQVFASAPAAAPMTQEHPVQERPGAEGLSPTLAGLLPVVAMPLIFLALRLGLTSLLGLTVLSLPWLAVGAMAMMVLALVLTRLLGAEALWLGSLLAVLGAIAETLLVVAPVALLSGVVAVRLAGSR